MGDTNIRDEYLSILNLRNLWVSAFMWVLFAGFVYYFSWIYQPDGMNLSFRTLFLVLSISTIGVITLFSGIILILNRIDEMEEEGSLILLIILISLIVPLIVNLIFRSINEINDIISDYYSSWDLVGLFSLQFGFFVFSFAMFYKIDDVEFEWYETHKAELIVKDN